MSGENSKLHDLGEHTIGKIEAARQVVRSGGSVDADFLEAKESGFLLRLLDIAGGPLESMRATLGPEFVWFGVGRLAWGNFP